MQMNGWVLELHLKSEKSKAKMRVKGTLTTFKDILWVREADQLTYLAGINRPLPLLSDINSAHFFLRFPQKPLQRPHVSGPDLLHQGLE